MVLRMIFRYIGDGRSKETPNMKFLTYKVIPYLESLFLRSIWRILAEKAGKGLKSASRAVILLFSLLLLPSCPNDDLPDLIVSISLDQSSVLSTDGLFSGEVTVRNQGDSSSPPTTVRYYQSTGSQISTNDSQLGTDSVSAIPAGESAFGSFSGTVPTATGTYYYGACVDSVADESDTSNNCSLAATLTVTDGTDGIGGSDDHGDTRSTASALTLNSPISGNIETEDDVDYFRIEVTQSGTLTVYTSGSLDTVGTLEDSSGFGLAGDDNEGSGDNFRIERSVSSATYYVKVEGFDVSDTGSYRLHADFTPDSGGSDDHGDTRSAASALTLNSSISGNIETGVDVDYFRIEVTQSGTLVVYTSGSLETYVILEDSFGSGLAVAINEGSGSNFRIEESVGSATYYINVEGFDSNDTGSYTLHAEFTPTSGTPTDDHGNTRSAASALTLNSSISGSIETGVDVDYFRIEVTQSGMLAVYTTGNLDTFGYLQDSSGSEITYNDDGGSGGNFRIEESVSSATYYIRIGGFGVSNTGSYTLHADFTPTPSNSPDLVVDISLSPTAVSAAGTFLGSVIIRNQGDTSSAATTVRYYSSTDSTISTSDNQLDTDSIPVILTNNGASESFVGTAPASAGTYYYGACVDSVAGESNTSNNCSSAVILTVASGTDDHGDTRSAATTLSLNSSLSGNIETGDDVDYFRIEVTQLGLLTIYTSGNLDTVGTLQDSSGTQLEENDQDGSEDNFRIAWSVSSATYYVKVESYESSETGSYRLHADFTPTPSNSPDLVTSISLTPISVSVGGTFLSSVIIRNQGDISSAATTVRYYSSTDSTISTSDSQLGTDSISVISTNNSASGSFVGTAPASAGTYYYGVCVDSVAGESNTSNNCSSAVILRVASGTDDHGNILSEATILSLGSPVSGNVEIEDGIDYFRVDITGPGKLNIYATGDAEIIFILGDSFGMGIDNGHRTNYGESRIEGSPVSSATYHIIVYGITTGSYTLHVDFTPD